MKKCLAICVVFFLVASVFATAIGTGVSVEDDSFLSERSDKENDTISSSEDLYQKTIEDDVGILGENVQEKASSRPDDELIEVVIRLSPHEFERTGDLEFDERGTEYVSELKDYSRNQQSEIKEFLERGDGEVINTFWIANAILVEIEVGELDKLTEFDQVWRIHENFKIQIQGSERFDSSSDVTDIEKSSNTCTETQIRENTEFSERAYCFDKEKHQETVKTEFIDDTESTSDDVTWGLDRINAPDVWDEGFDGTGVRVAVSDTGVDIDHPDLEGKMVTEDEDDSHYPGGWIEHNEDGNIVDDSVPHDTSDHGTHCSGTILGGDAGGTHIGVAPGAELMHALGLPEGTGTFAQLTASMEWKAEPYDRFGNPLHEEFGGDVEDYRAHVASMSWGRPGYFPGYEEPIQNLKNAGVVPIFPIGNEGEGTIDSPGAIYEALGVGASDEDDMIADFSSGDIVEDERDETPVEYVKPDLVAPGVDVKSSIPGGSWLDKSGTSMAAPHVAGTIALMLEANQDLTVGEIYEALKISADYYEAGETLFQERKNTRYGYGIINADKAVDSISGLSIGEPEDITNEKATLKGEIFEMPDEEVEVFFRYRQHGEDEWLETDSKTLTEPRAFEIELEGLEEDTTYEYKAVGEWNGKQELTFALSFTTHADVEILTLPEEDITLEKATLRGKITDLYLDEAEVFFRHREFGKEWSEIKVGRISSSQEFSIELDGLDDLTSYDYQAIAKADGEEFTGNIIEFTTPAPEPEWSDEEEAYLISTAPELQWMRNDLENDYILVDDIDASQSEEWYHGEGLDPIGEGCWIRFRGTFNGQGNVIENLHIDREKTDYVGLFASLSGEVIDVSIVNSDISGNTRVGGIVGRNFGTVDNSYVTGDLTGKFWIGGLVASNAGQVSNSYSASNVIVDECEIPLEWGVGGLVGFNEGTVYDSFATGNVVGESEVGGLVGSNRDGTVENSYATGDVSGGWYVGGLVGENSGTVENSYATGDVEGNNFVGGLVGGNNGTLLDSYATGDVSGYSRVGGLVGYNRGGTVENSYATGDVSGINWIGGLVGYNDGTASDSYWDIETSRIDTSDGGTGLKTEEMTGETAPNKMDGFDFNEIWETVEEKEQDAEKDGYPILQDLRREEQLEHVYPPEEYTLTINLDGEGSTDPKEGTHTYYEGGEVVVEATAEEGWYFDEWTGDASGTEEEITLTMIEDKEVTAHFQIKTYDLTVDTVGEGEVEIEPEKEEYEHDEEVTLTAVPNEGHEFVEWEGTDETVDSITITMDEDKEITAVFEEVVEYYELTINIDGEGSVEIDPDQDEYEEDTEVTLTADPDEGWKFEEWQGTDETGDSITVTMDEDKDITAVFEEEEENEEEDEEVPGFTASLLWLAAVIAVAIYHKKEQ